MDIENQKRRVGDLALAIRNERNRKRIMRKVYFLWFMRSAYAKLLGVAVMMGVMAFHVSIIDVVANTINASPSFIKSFGYLADSFLAADFLSKFFLVAISIGAIAAAKEFFNKENELENAAIRNS
ncbi:hypothetical protein C4572_04090 [Candidatus Parcubacteria bacterium]|nr:MAG: hypothetical protein C4572_04090 [Candidatus Parcubacteria bacterium]